MSKNRRLEECRRSWHRMVWWIMALDTISAHDVSAKILRRFHTTLSHTIFHTQLCHTLSFTHNFDTRYLSHTTLSHTIFDTWSFTHHFVTHHLSHTIFDTPSYTHHLSPHHLSHTHNFVTNNFSSTSSFVFPSFPVPAAKFVDHYWKKLTCGVMRSLNFLLNSVLYAHRRHAAELHAPTGILYENHSMFFTGHGQCSC